MRWAEVGCVASDGIFSLCQLDICKCVVLFFMYICKCSLMPFMYVLIVKVLSYVEEIKNIYLSTLIRLHQMEFPALINEDKSILNVRVVRYILSISFKKVHSVSKRCRT